MSVGKPDHIETTLCRYDPAFISVNWGSITYMHGNIMIMVRVANLVKGDV